MTDTQKPEALHLAEALEHFACVDYDGFALPAAAELRRLQAENEALRSVLKEVGLFLHHCWCDVQMNEYSFDKLNKMMERVDAAMKGQP